MSDTFFQQLEISKPDFNLNVGGGIYAEQTAGIMIGCEKLLLQEKSDLCLVVGDAIFTMACALQPAIILVPMAHIEASIKSGDETMPEEINRMVTDSITNYFFTTSEVTNENLRKSGVKEESIFFVGNTMIDTLLKNRPRFIKPEIWDELNLNEKEYLVLTLHWPANVDEEGKLKELIDEIIAHSQNLPLIFPIHLRTAKIIVGLGITHPRFYMIEPMKYLEFNYLVECCKAVITDSGGIAEEASVMGVPCMTLRDNTERPKTITMGTNELLGINPKAIKPAMEKFFSGNWEKGRVPEMWDGKTGERIVKILCELLFTANENS